MIKSIKEHSIGRWDDIYKSLNIEVFPKNTHKPCPICGGKDRFRYDDKDGNGSYICNQCGAGDGFNLIEKHFHYSTKETFNLVAECLNLGINQNDNEPKGARFKSDTTTKIQDNPVCKKVEYLLSKSKIGQSEYLTKKGLTFNLPLLDNGRIFAPLMNINGEYTGAQFIEADGRKHLMKGTNKKGAFIAICSKLLTSNEVKSRLSKSNEIIICEGLATGITLSLLKPDIPIIVAIDSGNLISVASAIYSHYPNINIIIGGDNDAIIGSSKNIGRDKAMESIRSIGGYISIPNTDYQCDWDDYRQKYGIERTLSAFNENLIKLEPKDLSKLDIDHSRERLQNNTPANKRADLLLSEYGGKLAFNREIKESYYYTGTHWERMNDYDLYDRLIAMYEEDKINYSLENIERVIRLATIKAPKMKEEQQGFIYFKNGVYDIKQMEFKPHSPNYYNTSTNNINYQASNSTSLEKGAPHFHKFLSDATKSNDKKFMGALAIFYLILANRHEWHYFIEINGGGGTGKSTFSEIARLLAGEKNTADCDLKELELHASTRTSLIDKTLVILSDQSRYQGDGALIKKLSAGDKIDINPKYRPAISYKPNLIVLAVNNNSMVFTGNDSGVNRRHIRLIFNEIVKVNNRDPHLLDKIRNELPFIINYLLKTFTDDKQTIAILEELKNSDEAEEVKRNNDPLYDFSCHLTSIPSADGLFIGMKVNSLNLLRPEKNLYHGYEVFYKSNHGKEPLISVKAFMTQIKTILKDKGIEYHQRRINGANRTNLIYGTDLNDIDGFSEHIRQ